MYKSTTKQTAFTIVELLIVIVVIGILAAITIVAYNGIQQRARDTTRKNDLASLAKALSLYNIDNGNYISTGSGCGQAGNGEGWVDSSVTEQPTLYQTSIAACLKNAKYIQSIIADPSGCLNDITMSKCADPTTTAYLKVNCTNGSEKYAYLMARLEISPGTSLPADAAAAYCPLTTSAYAPYGMNYSVRVS